MNTEEYLEDDFDRLSDADIAVILAVGAERMTKTRLQRIALMTQELYGVDLGHGQ